jgi:hypothetical protein
MGSKINDAEQRKSSSNGKRNSQFASNSIQYLDNETVDGIGRKMRLVSSKVVVFDGKGKPQTVYILNIIDSAPDARKHTNREDSPPKSGVFGGLRAVPPAR